MNVCILSELCNHEEDVLKVPDVGDDQNLDLDNIPAGKDRPDRYDVQEDEDEDEGQHYPDDDDDDVDELEELEELEAQMQ